MQVVGYLFRIIASVLLIFFLFALVYGIVRSVYAAIVRGPQRRLAEQKAVSRGFAESSESDLVDALGKSVGALRILKSGSNAKLQNVKYAYLDHRYKVWYSLLTYQTWSSGPPRVPNSHRRYLFALLDPSLNRPQPYLFVKSHCRLHFQVDSATKREIVPTVVACWPKLSPNLMTSSTKRWMLSPEGHRMYPLTMSFWTYPQMEDEVSKMWTGDLVDELLLREGDSYCLEIVGNVIVVAYDYDSIIRFGDKFDSLLEFPVVIANKLFGAA